MATGYNSGDLDLKELDEEEYVESGPGDVVGAVWIQAFVEGVPYESHNPV